MLKRTLCLFLLLCMLLQAFPLAVFAETDDDSEAEEITEIIAPEVFEIKGLNMQEGNVVLLSPEARTALVIVAQYKNGATVGVNVAEAELVIGRNTVDIPGYTADETASVKVMLWDSFAGMHPLCDCLEIGAKAFDVEFDTGVDGLTISKRTYPSNARFGKLPTPVTDGFLFIGWYYDKDSAQPVMEDDLVVDNCTLHAKTLDLDSLYKDGDTVFVERYVANAGTTKNTKILILSDDATMTEEGVLQGVEVKNLSVPEATGTYQAESLSPKALSVEKIAEIAADCEAQQAAWLTDMRADNDMQADNVFVLTAKDGFAEGNTYQVTLNDGRLSFAGHEVTARDYNLSIDKEQMSNLTLRDDIIFVNEELVHDAEDDEVQLSGISVTGGSGKSAKRFSLGSAGQTLTLGNNGSKLEIVSGSGSGQGTGTITISNEAGAVPNELNDQTLAVYSRNVDEEEVGLFGAEDLALPENLTLDASALWNMDFRTIEAQIDGDYIYTETNSRDVLFKPDVFPILGDGGKEFIDTNGDGVKETAVIHIDNDAFGPNKSITIPGGNQTYTYDDLGITDETTVDAGDFILFIAEDAIENGEPVHHYEKITGVTESEKEYKDETTGKITTQTTLTLELTSVSEEDVLSSMDMYGVRDLTAKELTGRNDDEFGDIEEQAALQAINSGFADNAAMYVSSVVIASEAFADLSKEYDLKYEEILDELTGASDFGEIVLFGEEKKYLYVSKGGAVKVSEPTVVAEVKPSFEIDGKVKAGIKLTLTVKGDITIDIAPKTSDIKSTITIDYAVTFEQTLRAEICMSAEASYRSILFIKILDDVTINANIDFYTTSDITINITAGLTSDADGEGSQLVWYAPKYGECYHAIGCSYKEVTDEREFTTIKKARNTQGKDGKLLRPCERCQPEEKVYVTPYGECYHRKDCFYLNESRANGTLVAGSIPLAEETGYRPCSRCCPNELFINNLSKELRGLFDKVNTVRDTVTNIANDINDIQSSINDIQNINDAFQYSVDAFRKSIEDLRTDLGGAAPEQADDAGAADDSESKPAALAAEKKLTDKYSALLSNGYSAWAEIYRLNLFNANVFSFFKVVNVSIGMDFCLYANLNVAVEAKLHYENAKRYIFTIRPFKGEVNQSVVELVPETLTFDFLAMGTAGLKMGIELAIGVNIFDDRVARLVVTGEIGFYIKLWGYFEYHYKNIRPLNAAPQTSSRCHGALYVEAGPYIEVGLSLSVFGEKKASPTLYYEEFPIITMGERNAVFGFANENLDSEFQLRRNYRTLALPTSLFSVAYLDLKTGETGKTAYTDDLKNARDMGSFTYVSKYYTISIKNDGDDAAFRLEPDTALIIVVPDGDKEESAEVTIAYNQPAYSFNKTAVTRKINLHWDNYGENHTIAFDSNGGDYVAPIMEPSNKDITLPTPVRPGYIFAGWSQDSSPTTLTSESYEKTTFYTDTVMPDEDVMLYAKWLPGTADYTVNHWQYDLKGIPQLADTETFTGTTESYVTPEPKTYTGFETPAKTTAQVIGDGSTEINYYYQRKTYLYELNVMDLSTRRLVRYGTPIVLTGREIPGYDFVGWYDENGRSVFDILDMEKTTGTLAFNFDFEHDLKLTAKFRPRRDTPYQIEYHAFKEFSLIDKDRYIQNTELLGILKCEGTTGRRVDLAQKTDLLDLMKVQNDARFTSYAGSSVHLEEWDYNSGISEDYVVGTIKGDGSLVLYVYYTEATRDITYSFGENYTAETPLTSVNASIPLPKKNPTQTGYTFTGWAYYRAGEAAPAYEARYNERASVKWSFYDCDNNQELSLLYDEQGTLILDKNGNPVSPILMPREPYNPRAIWTPNEYELTLHKQNDDADESLMVTYDVILPSLEGIPERDGYEFTGYYDGNTKYYDENGDAVLDAYTETADVVLTAGWKASDYSITYHLNDDGSVSKATNENSTGYRVDNTVTFNDPTRNGYTFEGWYTTPDFAEGTEITSTAGRTVNLDVYAKWTAVKYIITYTPNDSEAFTDSFTIEDAVTYAEPVLREHYNFSGWYDAYGNRTTGFAKGTTGDKTLVAHWEAKTYTINYHLNVDNDSAAQVDEPEDAYKTYTVEGHVTLPVLSRSGYGFEGWYTADGIRITSTEGCTDDLEVYAKWSEPTNNTINYNMNGGSNPADNPATYTVENTTNFVLYAPSRRGYTFDGWTTNTADVTVEESENETWIVTNLPVNGGTITFTANWTANTYTVTEYVLNRPEDASADIVMSTILAHYNWTYDQDGDLPNPTLEGLDFDGWYKDKDCTKDSYVGNGGATVRNLTDVNGGKIQLYAVWTPKKYTVTFNGNKPTGTSNVIKNLKTSENATYDKSFTLPTPTLDGYKFGGWYKDASCTTTTKVGDGGESVTNPNGTYAAEIKLYAKWTANKYNVEFNLNGGNSADTLPESMTYDVVYKINNPTRTGYTFTGWTIAGMDSTTHEIGGSNTTEPPLEPVTATTFRNLRATDGTVTFTANWTANTYTVTFKGNKPAEASNVIKNLPAEMAPTYDQSFTLRTPTLTGWTFDGWYTDADCKNEVPVDNNGEAENLTTENGVTVALYAGWTANTYTVVFNPNYDTAESVSRDYSYDTTPASYIPERSGWKFVGWKITGWKDSNGNTHSATGTGIDGGSVKIGDQLDGSADKFKNLTTNNGITVYMTAQWRGYKVTLHPGDGATGGTKAYYYLSNMVKTSGNNHYYYYTNESCTTGIVDEAITHIGIPSRSDDDDYVFAGYYSEQNGKGTMYVDTFGICRNNLYQQAKDVDLYAYWLQPCEVELIKGDGTGGTEKFYYLSDKHDKMRTGGTDSFTETAIYYYSKEACGRNYAISSSKITPPSQEGYTFAGYYTKVAGDGTQYVDANGNCNKALCDSDYSLSLYAKWTYTYTLIISENDTPQTITGVKGQKTAKIDIPTRPYYSFGGYYSQPNGQGTQYINQNGECRLAGKSMTLYAHWIEKEYLVNFDFKDGRDGTSTAWVSYTGKWKDATPTAPKRDGYIFTGYYSDDGNTRYCDSNMKYLIMETTSARTLYAHWVKAKSDEKEIKNSSSDYSVASKDTGHPSETWDEASKTDQFSSFNMYNKQNLQELKNSGYKYVDLTVKIGMKMVTQGSEWIAVRKYDNGKYSGNLALLRTSLYDDTTYQLKKDPDNGWYTPEIHICVSIDELLVANRMFDLVCASTGSGENEWKRGRCVVQLTPVNNSFKNYSTLEKANFEFAFLGYTWINYENDLLDIDSSENMRLYVTGGSGPYTANASSTNGANAKCELLKTFENPYCALYKITVNVNNATQDNGTISVKITDKNNQIASISRKWSKKTCVAEGTMIAMADGSQKPIEDIHVGDMVTTWSFWNGRWEAAPVALKFDHGTEEYKILALHFSNGDTVRVINNHGFFDMDFNTYAYITPDNVDNYVGHRFAVLHDGVTQEAKLQSYDLSSEVTGCYSLQTAYNENFVTGNVLSITAENYVGRYEYFDIGDNMRYEDAAMQKDIEKYGLYDYTEFADYMTREQFEMFNGPYFKVLVGKGVFAYEDILAMIENYLSD